MTPLPDSPTLPPRVPPKDSTRTTAMTASRKSDSSTWWVAQSVKEQEGGFHPFLAANFEKAIPPAESSTSSNVPGRGRAVQLAGGSQDLRRTLSDRTRQLSPSKRLSPDRARGKENLKLAPSPDLALTSTHRADIERKNSDQLQNLVLNRSNSAHSRHDPIVNPARSNNPPSSFRDPSPSSHRASASPTRGSDSATTPQTSLKRSVSLTQSYESSKKNLLDKLGKALPMLKPSITNASPEDPNKKDPVVLPGIATKAAQTLGTESFVHKYQHVKFTVPNEIEGNSSDSDRSLFNSPEARKLINSRGEFHKYPEPRLEHLNQSIESGTPTELSASLKFHGGDVLSTPLTKAKRAAEERKLSVSIEAANNCPDYLAQLAGTGAQVSTSVNASRLSQGTSTPFDLSPAAQQEPNFYIDGTQSDSAIVESVSGRINTRSQSAGCGIASEHVDPPVVVRRSNVIGTSITSRPKNDYPPLHTHYDDVRAYTSASPSLEPFVETLAPIAYQAPSINPGAQARGLGITATGSKAVPIFYDGIQYNPAGYGSGTQIVTGEHAEHVADTNNNQLPQPSTPNLESIITNMVEQAVARHLAMIFNRIDAIDHDVDVRIHRAIRAGMLSEKIDSHEDDIQTLVEEVNHRFNELQAAVDHIANRINSTQGRDRDIHARLTTMMEMMEGFGPQMEVVQGQLRAAIGQREEPDIREHPYYKQ